MTRTEGARRRRRGPPPLAERLTTVIAALVALKIVLLINAFLPTSLQAFDVPKSAVSRAMAAIIAGVLAIWLFAHGRGSMPRSRMHLVVAALLLANLLSAIFAQSPYVAIHGEWDRLLGLTFILDMAILYTAASVALNARLLGPVLIAIGGATVISAAYGLAQYAGRDPLAAIFVASQEGTDRPYSTVGNPDTFGHLISVGAPSALALSVLGTGRGQRLTALAVGIVLVVTGAVVATRAIALGWVGGAMALGAVLLLGSRRRLTSRHVVIIAFACIVLAATLEPTPLGTRVTQVLRGGAQIDRLLLYDSALRIFWDNPVVGVGPDNFAVAYGPYRQPGSDHVLGNYRQSSAHSWLFHSLATTGAAGTLALLTFAVAGLWTLWRTRDSAPAALLLVGTAAYWAHGMVSVGSIGIDWVPWFAAGAGVALKVDPAATSQPRAVRSLSPRKIAFVVGPALVFAALSLRPIAASVDAWHARARSEANDHAAAIQFADRAVATDGQRAEYWMLLGDVRSAGGRPREAADAYERAASLYPTGSIYWQKLAYARQRESRSSSDRDGRLRRGLDAAQRAVAADPQRAEPYYVLARLAIDVGAHELSLRAVVNSMRLRGRFDDDDLVAAVAAQRIDPEQARVLLEEALTYRESSILLLALGDTHLVMGDREGAASLARRVLEREPSNSDALKLLQATR